MSKERNLLKKFIDSNWQYDDWCLLKAEAEELLAQPEQEPLSDDEIYMGFQSSEITDISLRSFVIGIKFAEREHGIGDKL